MIAFGCTVTDSARTRTADLVLRNGNIVTVDAAFGQVQAIAVSDGRIVHVGTKRLVNPCFWVYSV